MTHQEEIERVVNTGRLKMRGGIDIKLYESIHQWIRYKYGSATKCESPTCNKQSTLYEWSKLKDCEYDYDIKNFWQLCKRCHAKYDFKEETREKARQSNPRTHQTHCKFGHEFTAENTYLKHIAKNPHRNCIKCRKLNSEKYRARVKYKKGKLLEFFRELLPMAKGYAFENPVGRNLEIIQDAENFLTHIESMKNEVMNKTP